MNDLKAKRKIVLSLACLLLASLLLFCSCGTKETVAAVVTAVADVTAEQTPDEGEAAYEISEGESDTLLSLGAPQLRAAPVAADTSWYDPEGNVFAISTAAELLGFVQLAAEASAENPGADNYFAGKTFKLTADIDLNPGWNGRVDVSGGRTAAVAPAAPDNVWTVIPSFSGTFDGQGHSISGIYVAAAYNTDCYYDCSGYAVKGSGLFTSLVGATIKNLVILNSAIVYTDGAGASIGTGWRHTGGIAGYAYAATTLDTIYSEMDIISTNTANTRIGGFLGRVDWDDYFAPDNVQLTNLVYAGNLVKKNDTGENDLAGIIPWMSGKSGNSKITDCLSLGGVYARDGQDYGVWHAQSGKTAGVDFAATVNCLSGTQGAAPGAGWTWCADQSSYLPATVTDLLNAVSEGRILPDTAWYDPAGSTFELSTAAELLGFVELCAAASAENPGADNYFAGKTFKLAADIDLNPGWSARVDVSGGRTAAVAPGAPVNVWTVIPSFSGTFDGQGHILRGVYIAGAYNTDCYYDSTGYAVKGTGMFVSLVGATVQNLVIQNSVIVYENGEGASIAEGWRHVGGIVGYAYAATTLDAIYSEMDIISTATGSARIGGFAGRVDWDAYFDPDNVQLKNLVYAGNLVKKNDVGENDLAGIIPWMSGKSGNSKTQNCLSLGGIYARAGQDYGAWHAQSGKTEGVDFAATVNCLTDTQNAAPGAGWTWCESKGSYLPEPVTELLDAISAGVIRPDTSWYNPARSTFEISTAAQLLGFAQLAAEASAENPGTDNYFAGKTFKLTADIDLNPGWEGRVNVNGGRTAATAPERPVNVWPVIPSFSGTFDGQGHILRGVYIEGAYNTDCYHDSDGGIIKGSGMFTVLAGATVKNLVILGSVIVYENGAGASVANGWRHVGGIAGYAYADTTLDTIYSEMDIVSTATGSARIGGFLGRVDWEDYYADDDVQFKNLVYAGNLVKKNNTGENDLAAIIPWMSGSSGNSKIADCLMLGSIYARTGQDYGAWHAQSGKTEDVDFALTVNCLEGAQDAAPSGDWTEFVRLGSYLPKTVTDMLPVPVWPVGPTADSNTASFDDGVRVAHYYKAMSTAHLTAYESALSAAGYTLVKSYSLESGSDQYRVYQNGFYTVYVSYLGAVGTARGRVVFEHGCHYDLTAAALPSDRVCDAQIWQLDPDNTYSAAAGGMGYLIRLTNGEFIVIDGGYRSKTAADTLLALLTANNVNPGKPVVAAWFLTHMHDDHYGVLDRFASEGHGSRVTVKGIYANLPESTIGDIGTSQHDTVMTAVSRYPGAVLYTVHSGMTIGFADATATILCTYEDVKQSYYNGSLQSNTWYDGNDTSTVVRFDVTDRSGAHVTKFMVMGDASNGAGNALEYTYTAASLRADMVQLEHHGMNANAAATSVSLYSTIAAPVVFFPADVLIYNNVSPRTAKAYDADNTFYNLYRSHSRDVNVWIKNNATEIIPAWDNVCLTLPYTAGTYLDGTGMRSGNTVNCVTAHARRVSMWSAAAFVKIQTGTTAPANGKVDVYFVASVKDVTAAGLRHFGFEITMQYGGTVRHWTRTVNDLYTSVNVAGGTVTAAELEGDYVYAYVLRDVPVEAALSLTVTAFAKLQTNERLTSTVVKTVTVENGAIV